jgi:hypothetical protein
MTEHEEGHMEKQFTSTSSDYGRTAQWIRKLQGLSDEPLLRAAQIALAAIDEIITADVLDDDTAVVAAYEALQTAIAERAEVVL